ncbi:polysaccharide pyruvyl transferase family protein [Celeribacter sp. PS-C1]|uniref:polysaccharide pyruvyl transferase family protein n=1 Tax=Celeribacter sp. PS-C1 TaxID=2820813 RepID=UPI001C67E2EF|nr:polysaccharide pyruvyl transferase family protein [Celeribacter sp. PS-C1]MBW6416671.1 polysaccharide pyruvyl transferase family protein [Celeribacter sp. PS-C1]
MSHFETSESYANASPSKFYKLASKLGFTNPWNVYWFYSATEGLNFGDWIGPYLFNKITGRKARLVRGKGPLGDVLLSCGSILGHVKRAHKAIVWGSGVLTEETRFPEPKEIHAVRGPLSREVCIRQGYDCPEIYGDPGSLMPLFFDPERPEEKADLGIIPHHSEVEDVLAQFGHKDGVKIIDVRRPLETVISDIVACHAIVSTSLHGVIIADAYKVPVAWATFHGQLLGGDFKFKDYFLGIGLTEMPIPVDLKVVQDKDALVKLARERESPDLTKVQQRLLTQYPTRYGCVDEVLNTLLEAPETRDV